MRLLAEQRRTAAVLESALPRVDLLPPEIGQRSRQRRVQVAVGCGLLAAVGVVAALSTAGEAARQDADAELTVVSARGAALQAETAKYVDVLAVHQRADGAQDMLSLALAEEVRFSELLDDLSRTVPDNVSLDAVTFSQPTPAPPAVAGGEPGIGTVTFTGAALSHDDVAAWLDSLATQDGYAEPSLTSSTASSTANAGDGQATVTFTSSVTLTSAALSGRHTSTSTGG